MLFVTLVYRPEAADHDGKPFDGVEVWSVRNGSPNEDALQRLGERNGWKFHIEPITNALGRED